MALNKRHSSARLAQSVLLTAIFDVLDGTLARMSGRTSRFGAYLDSTLDRFSEAAIYLGLLIYFMGQNTSIEIVLIYFTIVGSLMVSYTRSRAEGIGISITQGLLTRTERIVLLVLALVLNLLTFGLWLLAILSHLTALQRRRRMIYATYFQEGKKYVIIEQSKM